MTFIIRWSVVKSGTGWAGNATSLILFDERRKAGQTECGISAGVTGFSFFCFADTQLRDLWEVYVCMERIIQSLHSGPLRSPMLGLSPTDDWMGIREGPRDEKGRQKLYSFDFIASMLSEHADHPIRRHRMPIRLICHSIALQRRL